MGGTALGHAHRAAGRSAAEVSARLAAADGIHYLGKLGDEVIHAWGRIHDYFHEFMLIDREAGQITLIIAAAD